MSLDPPQLDDRDFESLFREVRSRIPEYLPEWTDWNRSDPGITLLELHSWLAETILYRLNRVPELHHVKFLQMLGIDRQPAQAAGADLTFAVDPDAVNGSTMVIPAGTLVEVGDSDADEPLYFETDESLTAMATPLQTVVVRRQEGVDNVSEANRQSDQTFEVFTGRDDAEPNRLYLGFAPQAGGVARAFPREEVGLYVLLDDGDDQMFSTPSLRDLEDFRSEDSPLVALGYDGVQWQPVDVVADETRGFDRSGYLYVRADLQLPPVTASSVLDEVQDEDDEPLYWLCIQSRDTYGQPPEVERILTNTVAATAAVTVRDEAVGSSDGTPNQTFRLAHRPVLSQPPPVVQVREETGFERWERVEDFFGSTGSDRHYVLDEDSGELRFGDGLRGRIPPEGQQNIVARSYRHGGGRHGNVGANTITDPVDAPAAVDEVTNWRAATGGDERESLDDVKLRAGHDIRSRQRAVTLEDFEHLVESMAGVRAARVHARRTDTDAGGRGIEVTVVPRSRSARPRPTEPMLDAVATHLDERRLVTTDVQVVAPTYLPVMIDVDLRADDGAQLRRIKQAVRRKLTDYFDPLDGGRDGAGWPFGRDIYYSEVLGRLMTVDGVRRVVSATMTRLVEPLDEQTDHEQTDHEQTEPLDERRPGLFEGTGSIDEARVTVTDFVDDEPVETTYLAVRYDCTDLIVDDGALVWARSVDVRASYERSGGQR